MRPRVVITGMGVITPLGIGLESCWSALIAGRSGIRKIQSFHTSKFKTQIAGEVPEFEATNYIERKEARRMDRYAQFAVAGAGMAIEDAGLELTRVRRERAGVIVGSGIGGIHTFEDQARVLMERGPDRVSPLFVPMMIGNMAAGQIALTYGLCGPNTTVVTACASSNHAIGDAFRVIERGDADLIITGGTEASVTPLALAGFCAMKATSARNEEPEKASRPFDAQRDGFVMSEGCGILVVESLEHALDRGARIYAEIIGYGTSCDAYHITAPDPEGKGAALCMQAALKDAGLEPGDVDYINAHGTSTSLNDRVETLAIKKVFGPAAADLAISSTKSMTGHLLGAAGGLEGVVCSLVLQRGIIPPTVNYENPDPECDLDYVPNVSRKAEVGVCLSNGFGFGGHNATLVFQRYGGE
ncbi:MAG: beta-ketoacyl-ACP synthase II [Candidatus Desulforudis sp.]|nr:beta-ketoacyl-ACP synthase II [Desulforudis sp.]